jgi:hypothetical protein
MLVEALIALASAGGAAVVQAAATDAWEGFRQQVAHFFGRGDRERERAELERLDQTAAALAASDASEVELLRLRQEASWQTRFETLLESLDGTEREQAAAELRGILNEQADASRGVSTGQGGVAVGGNMDVRADGGSIAGGVIHGGATVGTPTQPDPARG